MYILDYTFGLTACLYKWVLRTLISYLWVEMPCVGTWGPLYNYIDIFVYWVFILILGNWIWLYLSSLGFLISFDVSRLETLIRFNVDWIDIWLWFLNMNLWFQCLWLLWIYMLVIGFWTLVSGCWCFGWVLMYILIIVFRLICVLLTPCYVPPPCSHDMVTVRSGVYLNGV